MHLKPEAFPRIRRANRITLIALAASALAACSVQGPYRPSAGTPEIVPRISNAVPAVIASPPPPPAEPAPAPAQPVATDVPAQSALLARVLSYAERVRSMPAAELSSEAARLSAPAESGVPASQMQLALVLGQTRQLPDLVRAHETVGRVLANPGTEAQPLHTLARMLAFRFSEQRRAEDQLDKERQQSRELQKKLDQTNERLEALKAIERSLTTRPPPPPVAPLAPEAPTSAPARRRPSAP